MEFFILSRQQVESYDITEPHVNISIRNPDYPPAELSAKATGRKAALFVAFDDVDDPTMDGYALTDMAGNVKRHISLITPLQAKHILDFFNKWKDKVGLVVVNCEAGISRSSGTAAALAVSIGESDEFVFNNRRYHPNRLVYRSILNERYGNGQEEKKDS